MTNIFSIILLLIKDLLTDKSEPVDVKINYKLIVNADFLNWLLERCDSYPGEKIARCGNETQAKSLMSDLLKNGIESELMEELHVPKRLEVEKLYFLQNWYRSEKPFSKPRMGEWS